MKQALKSYITFSRSGRVALICLMVLLIILISIRLVLSGWKPANEDAANEQKLVTAWEKFKRSQPDRAEDSTFEEQKDFQDVLDKNQVPMNDLVDLNTVDSATLVRFKGIGPVTAGRIVNYRKQHGRFRNIDELKGLGSFSESTYEILKNHLVIYNEN